VAGTVTTDLLRIDPLLSLCLASPNPAVPAISLSPAVVIPLLLVAWLYARGARALALRGRPLPAGMIVSFTVGMALLALALVSPLCRLAASLASAHMIQHILVVVLAPALLVAARAHAAIGLPRLPNWARALQRPGPAATVFGLVIWGSHLPPVYQGALLDPFAHLALLAAQLAGGFLFWGAVIPALRLPRGDAALVGGAALATFVTFVHTGLLGAILAFAARPWYPVFGDAPVGWGLTPLEDQQIAGLIMWVPMGLILFGTGLVIMARLLQPGAIATERAPG
jgi:cytochrome c oxidase assembly factor CtaG